MREEIGFALIGELFHVIWKNMIQKKAQWEGSSRNQRQSYRYKRKAGQRNKGLRIEESERERKKKIEMMSKDPAALQNSGRHEYTS